MSYTEHHYRSRDGLSLYYRSYGSGDDVVICLPGLTRNCKDFEDLARHLSTRWRVISPDLRGRGRSDHDPNPSQYFAGAYARDIWTLLDGLGIRNFAIIGTSLGGLIAMNMADQQAGRLRGVVLNDVGPEFPPDAASRILQYVGRTPPSTDWNAAAKMARQKYSLAYPGMGDVFWQNFVRLSYAENEDGQPAPDMDPAIGDALRKAYSALKLLRWLRRLGLKRRVAGINIDTWDSFRAMVMPCLLLHGELSDVLNRDIIDRMQSVKPDLETVTVPERGHAPLLDEPVARSAIDSFLGRLIEVGKKTK
jgi:pimeloyl-ACP methyl ester carboxylesterase